MSTDVDSRVSVAIYSSWVINWVLLVVKFYAFLTSGSKAIAASLADSIVDIVTQFVFMTAGRYMAKPHPNYPVGRSRLEALSVLACASIMGMAAVEVIQFSCVDISDGAAGDKPTLSVTWITYILLALTISLKLALFVVCRMVTAAVTSETVAALAEDHFNDVVTNIGACAAVAIATHTSAWWVDPVGAILMSLMIIVRWGSVMMEQVKKIVGYTAPPEFIRMITDIARSHDSRLEVDCIRAYHFGARYVVEMEIVLPGSMTVKQTHDIALDLQHHIERLREVERAHVHVDHHFRDGLEHKVERELNLSTVDSQRPSPRDANTSSTNTSPNKEALHEGIELSNI